MNFLSFQARTVIDELIAQLKCRAEALQGVEVTIIETELAYRKGKFVVKNSKEEKRTLGGEQVLADLVDPLDCFDNTKCHIQELASGRHGEVRLRAIPIPEKQPEADSYQGKEEFIMTLIISRVPMRLLSIEAKMINVPRWFKWVIKSLDASIEFDYIRGVPV